LPCHSVFHQENNATDVSDFKTTGLLYNLEKKVMKIYFALLIPTIIHFSNSYGQHKKTYVGSTPCHQVVRNFLEIPFADSIDFIRWKLEMEQGSFKLQCKYGISKAGTPGFVDEKKVAFEGEAVHTGDHYYLRYKGKKFSILEVNSNLLHLLDQNNNMLVGNGGYSYALNNTDPVKTDEFNIHPAKSTVKYPLVFEGRTPCQEIAMLLDLHKTEACNKMKWYVIFYADSVTGKPSYYLKGGMGYRKETMERGKWQIITGKDGRIIYKVNPDDGAYSLYLLKGDDNILFFIDPSGRLLTGNEDFSYTLNRRKEEYSPIYR